MMNVWILGKDGEAVETDILINLSDRKSVILWNYESVGYFMVTTEFMGVDFRVLTPEQCNDPNLLAPWLFCTLGHGDKFYYLKYASTKSEAFNNHSEAIEEVINNI